MWFLQEVAAPSAQLVLEEEQSVMVKKDWGALTHRLVILPPSPQVKEQPPIHCVWCSWSHPKFLCILIYFTFTNFPLSILMSNFMQQGNQSMLLSKYIIYLLLCIKVKSIKVYVHPKHFVLVLDVGLGTLSRFYCCLCSCLVYSSSLFVLVTLHSQAQVTC